jgi:CheY-like chemotaxis protein
MRRLVFIDDDKTELDTFLRIVGSEYDCTTVHWPPESAKLFGSPAPDIFVSDLYLPPLTGVWFAKTLRATLKRMSFSLA